MSKTQVSMCVKIILCAAHLRECRIFLSDGACNETSFMLRWTCLLFPSSIHVQWHSFLLSRVIISFALWRAVHKLDTIILSICHCDVLVDIVKCWWPAQIKSRVLNPDQFGSRDRGAPLGDRWMDRGGNYSDL